MTIIIVPSLNLIMVMIINHGYSTNSDTDTYNDNVDNIDINDNNCNNNY